MTIRPRPRPAPAATEPEAAKAAIAGPGHNRPDLAADVVREFEDLLRQSKPDFDEREQMLLGGADRAAITDTESFGRGGELKKQISAMLSLVDKAHTEAKHPYLHAGKAVDGAKNSRRTRLAAALVGVQGKLDTYVREEAAQRAAEARRRAEQQRVADQARLDAEAAAGTGDSEFAEVAELPRVEPEKVEARGDYGTLTRAQSVWRGDVSDYAAAFAAIDGANNDRIREVIDKVIAAKVRAGERTIPGVRIYEDHVAR